MKPIGEIKRYIGKKMIFGGFNNEKLRKGNNKYHQILIFGSNRSQKHVWMIINVFSYMHYNQICLNVFINDQNFH